MPEAEDPVVIVEYDPSWPRMFEEEKARIITAAGKWIMTIEHIGSTAVPGLGGKPIIDLLAGVRVLALAASCVPRLGSIGYLYHPEKEGTLPERGYFDKPSYHLHMVEESSDFWSRHIAFRDHLRRHPETAMRYLDLKRAMAQKYRVDREGYTAAKTHFIVSTLKKAGYVSKV
ncbi:MAG: GrpB family protein [Nitrososphaerales archaeon]|nr:GrpB family protein [Nitrososphaerales archaeon]